MMPWTRKQLDTLIELVEYWQEACAKADAEVQRLREAIEYAIVHAENHDVIRVLDEVMKND